MSAAVFSPKSGGAGARGQIASPFGHQARRRRALYRGWAALANGDPAAAEQAGRRSLDRLPATEEAGPTTPIERELLVSGLELVAGARREYGDFTGSADLHRQALTVLAAQRPHPQGSSDQTCAASSSLLEDSWRCAVHLRLGENLRLLGDYTAAEQHHRHSLTLVQQAESPDPAVLAWAFNGLGIVYKDTGRFDHAHLLYRHALVVASRVFGANSPELAAIYHNLAGLDHAQGRYIEAEHNARRALALRAPGEGPSSSGMAADLAVLGAILVGQQRYAQAEPILRRASEIWRTRYGPQHYEVAVVEHNLAALYGARGELAHSEALYQHVLDVKQRVLGADHPAVVGLRRLTNSTGPSPSQVPEGTGNTSAGRACSSPQSIRHAPAAAHPEI